MSGQTTAPTASALVAGGFARTGVWVMAESSGFIRLVTETPVSHEPGVYAFIVEEDVRYIGSAQRGLHRRFRQYEISKTLMTTHRVRQEILAVLSSSHEVAVLTMVPAPMTLDSGLPLDSVVGLEAGLIRAFQPAWNLRGRQSVQSASRRSVKLAP